MKHEPKKSEAVKITNFLESMDWMFSTQYYEKNIILKKRKSGRAVLRIVYIVEYQQITIEIYPGFWELSLKEQRKALLHEMCHTITIPSKMAACDLLDGVFVPKERIVDINEEATSRIENILDRLLSNGLDYAKQAYADYLKPKNETRTKKKKLQNKRR